MIKPDSFPLDSNFVLVFLMIFISQMNGSELNYFLSFIVFFFFEIIGFICLVTSNPFMFGVLQSLLFNLDEVLLYMLFPIYFSFCQNLMYFLHESIMFHFSAGMFCSFNLSAIMNSGTLLSIKDHIFYLQFLFHFWSRN